MEHYFAFLTLLSSFLGLLQKLNKKGLTKTALAKELGISSRTVDKIGRGEIITDHVLEKIAVFFGCSADELQEKSQCGRRP
ncbi:MAG: helix-turn-helix transcriptional regulator [Lachnospiraceae bacterium]|jgi:transcriptional regulator with XRE-family HTH domain|nr:helix-turn-helix transcriptional regulator [Lachnospiraceae bacterium]